MSWEDEWRMAHERSPLRVTVENEWRWNEYWDRSAAQYLREVSSEAALYHQVIDHLQSKGWLGPEEDVLDIGCGPGTYSLLLANKVRSVTALDSSLGMLDVLSQECKARGLENVRPLCRSWERANIEKGYDLVLAALSPAVSTATGLFAMEKASRSKCCYITACVSNWMKTRNELWEMVVGEFVPSDAYSIKYPFNILLETGRLPDLHHITATVEVDFPSRQVIDNYVRYFRIFTAMDLAKVKAIEDYIGSRSQGGVYTRRTDKCLCIMSWNRPED